MHRTIFYLMKHHILLSSAIAIIAVAQGGMDYETLQEIRALLNAKSLSHLVHKLRRLSIFDSRKFLYFFEVARRQNIVSLPNDIDESSRYWGWGSRCNTVDWVKSIEKKYHCIGFVFNRAKRKNLTIGYFVFIEWPRCAFFPAPKCEVAAFWIIQLVSEVKKTRCLLHFPPPKKTLYDFLT